MEELENSIYGSVRKHKCSEVGLPYDFLNPVLVLWEQTYIKNSTQNTLYLNISWTRNGVMQARCVTTNNICNCFQVLYSSTVLQFKITCCH